MQKPAPSRSRRKVEWWCWPLIVLLVGTGLGLGYLRSRSGIAEVIVEGFYAVSNLVFVALLAATVIGWGVRALRRLRRGRTGHE